MSDLAEEAYIELYDVVAIHSEILQAPTNDVRAQLPLELIGSLLASIVTGAAGSFMGDYMTDLRKRLVGRTKRDSDGCTASEEDSATDGEPVTIDPSDLTVEDTVALLAEMMRLRRDADVLIRNSAMDRLQAMGANQRIAREIADELMVVVQAYSQGSTNRNRTVDQ